MIIGLGTLFNVLCIVFGGLCGLFCKKLLKPSMQETLMAITGVAILFFGIGGTLEKMLQLGPSGLQLTGTKMMIISLALGTLIGEFLGLDQKINRFGAWIQKKSRSGSDSSFVQAFANASCTVCIGAMAVIGSIEDGIYGNYSILLIKGILDAIIISIMTASQGKGCIFSAVPTAVFQGSITLIAFFAGPFLPNAAVSNLSYVGSVLIFCVGLNLIREKSIPVANALPAVIIAAIWGYF